MAWSDEAGLLAEMARWEPLPDEADPRWDVDPAGADDVWTALDRLTSAAHVSGERGWREVAIRVFEHATDWDAHGAMQAIRHGPERAYSRGPDDVQLFASRLEPLTRHVRAGTRLWVTRELGILRRVSSLPFLIERLHDPHSGVVDQARTSIDMLAQDHPTAAQHVPPEHQSGAGGDP